MTPLTHPAKKIYQMDSEIKDVGQSYMFKKKFINKGGMPDIFDFQTKPNIEWRISMAYRQFFPAFPGFNSTWNFQ